DAEEQKAHALLSAGKRTQKAQELIWTMYNKVEFICNYKEARRGQGKIRKTDGQGSGGTPAGLLPAAALDAAEFLRDPRGGGGGLLPGEGSEGRCLLFAKRQHDQQRAECYLYPACRCAQPR